MESLDINPRIINAANKAKLVDFGTVLSLSASDLQRSTQLSLNDIKLLQQAVARAVHTTPCMTALQLSQGTCPRELGRSLLSTGCSVIDKFLRGGLLSQMLIEVAGQSASGKTQLCMQLSLTVQLPKSLGGLEAGAVYICTEDVFPNKRLIQMASLFKQRCSDPRIKSHEFTDHIFIEHAAEMEDLWYCISKKIPVLLAQGRVRLVVIDSVAALFRCEFDKDSTQTRAKQMRRFASQLLKLATQHNIPVVCVNQVSDLIGDTSNPFSARRKVIPALGISWANLVTMRVMLMRTNQRVSLNQTAAAGSEVGGCEAVVRSMEVLFAPHLPNSICHYVVDQYGVKGLQ